MTKKFDKLTRPSMRSVGAGQSLMEHGIRYTRLPDGDARFSIDIMVNRQRIHRVLGLESEGVTRQRAEEAIEHIRTEARHKRLNLPEGRKTPITFREAAHKYIEKLEQVGGKNIKPKKRHLLHVPKNPDDKPCDYLRQFFGDKPLDDIEAYDVRRYCKWRKDAMASPSTINRELATLSHLFGQAREWRWTRNHPKIQRLKEDHNRTVYLSQQQAEHVLEAAKATGDISIYLFILIGLHTGMRLMEILSIRIEHIDFEKRRIYLPHTKTGADYQEITSALAEYLKGHIDGYCNAGQEWLFPSPKSKTGHQVNIRKVYRSVIKAAGLDPDEVVRHTLRHTFCSHLVQAGVDTPTAKRLSRHKTTAVFERYTHQDNEHLQHAMDKLENRLWVFRPGLKAVK